jgi:hypothetical protein
MINIGLGLENIEYKRHFQAAGIKAIENMSFSNIY